MNFQNGNEIAYQMGTIMPSMQFLVASAAEQLVPASAKQTRPMSQARAASHSRGISLRSDSSGSNRSRRTDYGRQKHRPGHHNTQFKFGEVLQL